jgi:hypothetical protein
LAAARPLCSPQWPPSVVATTGAARAAASPYVNYQWPTVCDTYSVPTISNPTWQQQLIGVPTAPVKYMYTEEPSIVTN